MTNAEQRQEGDDGAALALSALAWTLSDDDRAGRMIALTGLDPANLRARLGEPEVLVAARHRLETA